MKKQTILVTGGCGFIGSHFINYMHKTYPTCFIINIDKLDYVSDTRFIQQQSPDRYCLFITNLTNQNNVLQILNSFDIDIVVHFAAQSHVDNSFGNSIQFTHDNVLGTHVLLECCRLKHQERPIEKIIHISTDEVYGEVDNDHEGCIEKSLLNPTNPYAATKAGAEFIVRSYYHSYKLPIIITRGNNVFGTNQYPEKVIPRFINQLLKNEKLTIQGDGSTRRNFIYVENVCEAVDTIIQKGQINEIYNIGCNDEFSVLEIARMLMAYCRDYDESTPLEDHLLYIPDRLFNDHRYAIDSSKLQQLGWKLRISFEDGLRETVTYWKEKLKKAS